MFDRLSRYILYFSIYDLLNGDILLFIERVNALGLALMNRNLTKVAKIS